MPLLPQEQPPVEQPARLREWLSRMMLLINGALRDKDNLEPTGKMPTVAYNGMVKYFSVAIPPDISYPGPWMYIEGEWVSMNKKIASTLRGLHEPDQVPLGVGIPMQIKFGPPQVSSDGAISLDSDGTITFIKDCVVSADVITHYVRDSQNNECFLIFDTTFNGGIGPNSLIRSIGSAGEPEGFEISFTFSGQVGDIIKLFMTRDTAGTNDGYLRTFYPTDASHALGHSASISITREV